MKLQLSGKIKLSLHRFTFLLISLLLAVSFFATNVFSQENGETSEGTSEETTPGYDAILQEYNQAKAHYEEAHTAYILARSQYLRFKTLKSRNDAREATLNMLEARADVVILYLTAIRERLNGTVGVPTDRSSNLTILLNEEINWFESHKAQLPSAATPEDLAKDSDEAKVQFTGLEPLLYEVKATISYGRIVDLHERTVDLFSEIQSEVEEIRNDEREGYSFNDPKMQVIDRWMSESDGRLFRSREKLNSVELQLEEFKKTTRLASGKHTDVVKSLEEGRQYLSEGLSFMNEVLREIKTAEE